MRSAQSCTFWIDMHVCPRWTQVLGLLQVEKPQPPENLHVAGAVDPILLEAPAHRVMPTRKQLEAGEMAQHSLLGQGKARADG